MKNFYFNNTNECNEFLDGTYNEIFKHELVFFDKSEKTSMDMFLNATKSIVNLNKNTILKIFPKDLKFVTTFLIDPPKICLKIHDHSQLSFNNEVIAPYIDFIDSIELFPSSTNLDDFFHQLTLQKEYTDNLKRILINPHSLDLDNDCDIISKHLNTLQRTNVYFSPTYPKSKEWQKRTHNIAKGPSRVDIDISNTCSHNCIFCGLYNEKSVAKIKKDAEHNPQILEIYKQNITSTAFFKIIEQLPDNLDYVTLGGAGEPFSHPEIMTFIKMLRNRNINITIFSHYSVLTEKIIDELTELAEYDNYKSLNFIVNISGATSETYIKTRPNQTERSFNRVTSLIKYTNDLYSKKNKGICITLMCVTNTENYFEMPAFVGFTKRLNAKFLWIKPVEISGNEMKSIIIPAEDNFKYAKLAKLTLHLAKLLSVRISHDHVLQLIIQKHENELREYEKINPFNKQVKEALIKYDLFGLMLDQEDHLDKNVYKDININKNPIIDPGTYEEYIMSKTEDIELVSDYKVDDQQIIQNAGYALKYFDENPCHIGQDYIRFTTKGEVLPCCIYPHSFMKPEKINLDNIWFSNIYNEFRSETLSFNKVKHHRQNPKFEFCHQCPHMDIQHKLK